MYIYNLTVVVQAGRAIPYSRDVVILVWQRNLGQEAQLKMPSGGELLEAEVAPFGGGGGGMSRVVASVVVMEGVPGGTRSYSGDRRAQQEAQTIACGVLCCGLVCGLIIVLAIVSVLIPKQFKTNIKF